MYCGDCKTSTAKLFLFLETVMLLACLRPGGGRGGVLVEAFLTTSAGNSRVRNLVGRASPVVCYQGRTRWVRSAAFDHGPSGSMLGWSLPTLLPSARTSSRQSTARSTRLFASAGGTSNDDSGGWKVPKRISIPEESLEMSFIKSSGAGGQNVNKVNTQVQIKFFIESTGGWIPYEVRQRLRQQQQNRINKEGYLVLQVQEHRTQTQNRKTAIAKLQEMILQAWVRPKVRHMRTGISVKTKRQRREDKRKRSAVKEGRRRVDC